MTAPTDREQAQAPRVSDALEKIAGNTYQLMYGFGHKHGTVAVPYVDWSAVVEGINAYRDARAEIARLTAELATARTALKPFAMVASHDVGSLDADSDLYRPMKFNLADNISIGHLRAALAALTPPSEDRADG